MIHMVGKCTAGITFGKNYSRNVKLSYISEYHSTNWVIINSVHSTYSYLRMYVHIQYIISYLCTRGYETMLEPEKNLNHSVKMPLSRKNYNLFNHNTSAPCKYITVHNWKGKRNDTKEKMKLFFSFVIFLHEQVTSFVDCEAKTSMCWIHRVLRI